jgi:hypothetical protein
MKTIKLTDAEHELIVSIMKEVDKINSVTSCCDDWWIENTPDNFTMVEEMEAWNCNKTLNEFRNDPESDKPRIINNGREIFIPRFLTYAYAIYLLESKI